jgi:purine-binding chemotaxis protein CheW
VHQSAPLQVCVFRLGEHSFALRLEFVSEITAMAELSRPPLLPRLLEGFLNIGGMPIPVIRLGEMLGLSSDPLELYTPLILLRNKQQPMALLVKSVTGIFSVPEAAVSPLAPGDSFNGCAESQLTLPDETIVLLSLDRLLLEKEQRAISEFQAIEARRLLQAAAPLG